MHATDIEREIRTFLVDNFLFGRSERLHNEDPLLGNVIDSTGVLEFVIFLQDRFAITIGEEEVTSDNLASVDNTVAFLRKKLGTKY